MIAIFNILVAGCLLAVVCWVVAGLRERRLGSPEAYRQEHPPGQASLPLVPMRRHTVIIDEDTAAEKHSRVRSALKPVKANERSIS
jgi:hypothetical protein